MRKNNFSKFYIFGGLAAAIILLIFFNSIGWLEPPKKIIYSIVAPASKPILALGIKISDAAGVVFNLKDIIDENAQLERENRDLALKLSGFLETMEENKLLRQQLGAQPPIKSKLLLANVVGLDPGNLGRYFLIDRGRKDGCEVGQGVIFAGGFLVGKITETSDNLSKVVVLTDSDSAIFALTEETRTRGAVKGDHGVGLILDMVPPEKEIKQDELVASSGLDGKIPAGLIIGKVAEKISGESEVFQRFKIQPAVSFEEIKDVFVVLGNE